MKRNLIILSYGLTLWILGGLFLFFIATLGDASARDTEKINFTLGATTDRKKLVDTVRTGFTDDPALASPGLGNQSDQERAEEVELHLSNTQIEFEKMQDTMDEVGLSNFVISPQVP